MKSGFGFEYSSPEQQNETGHPLFLPNSLLLILLAERC